MFPIKYLGGTLTNKDNPYNNSLDLIIDGDCRLYSLSGDSGGEGFGSNGGSLGSGGFGPGPLSPIATEYLSDMSRDFGVGSPSPMEPRGMPQIDNGLIGAIHDVTKSFDVGSPSPIGGPLPFESSVGNSMLDAINSFDQKLSIGSPSPTNPSFQEPIGPLVMDAIKDIQCQFDIGSPSPTQPSMMPGNPMLDKVIGHIQDRFDAGSPSPTKPAYQPPINQGTLDFLQGMDQRYGVGSPSPTAQQYQQPFESPMMEAIKGLDKSFGVASPSPVSLPHDRFGDNRFGPINDPYQTKYAVDQHYTPPEMKKDMFDSIGGLASEWDRKMGVPSPAPAFEPKFEIENPVISPRFDDNKNRFGIDPLSPIDTGFQKPTLDDISGVVRDFGDRFGIGSPSPIAPPYETDFEQKIEPINKFLDEFRSRFGVPSPSPLEDQLRPIGKVELGGISGVAKGFDDQFGINSSASLSPSFGTSPSDDYLGKIGSLAEDGFDVPSPYQPPIGLNNPVTSFNDPLRKIGDDFGVPSPSPISIRPLQDDSPLGRIANLSKSFGNDFGINSPPPFEPLPKLDNKSNLDSISNLFRGHDDKFGIHSPLVPTPPIFDSRFEEPLLNTMKGLGDPFGVPSPVSELLPDPLGEPNYGMGLDDPLKPSIGDSGSLFDPMNGLKGGLSDQPDFSSLPKDDKVFGQTFGDFGKINLGGPDLFQLSPVPSPLEQGGFVKGQGDYTSQADLLSGKSPFSPPKMDFDDSLSPKFGDDQFSPVKDMFDEVLTPKIGMLDNNPLAVSHLQTGTFDNPFGSSDVQYRSDTPVAGLGGPQPFKVPFFPSSGELRPTIGFDIPSPNIPAPHSPNDSCSFEKDGLVNVIKGFGQKLGIPSPTVPLSDISKREDSNLLGFHLDDLSEGFGIQSPSIDALFEQNLTLDNSLLGVLQDESKGLGVPSPTVSLKGDGWDQYRAVPEGVFGGEATGEKGSRTVKYAPIGTYSGFSKEVHPKSRSPYPSDATFGNISIPMEFSENVSELDGTRLGVSERYDFGGHPKGRKGPHVGYDMKKDGKIVHFSPDRKLEKDERLAKDLRPLGAFRDHISFGSQEEFGYRVTGEPQGKPEDNPVIYNKKFIKVKK